MKIKLMIFLVILFFDTFDFEKKPIIYNINIFNNKIRKIKEMSLKNSNSSYYNDINYDNIVVISVSDGLRQAKCFSSKNSYLNNALDNSILKATKYIKRHKLFPKFVKVDFSNYINNLSSSSLSDYIIKENINSFKYGIYFNKNDDYILLKEEINCNQIINYKKMDIDIDNLNNYLNINLDKIPNNISLFTTFSYFCDENYNVYKISNNNDNLGFRDIENVNVSLIEKIIETSKDYLNNIILDNGKFIYCYNALTDTVSSKYNFVRHTGSCWALAETMTKDYDDKKLNLAFDYILNHIIYKDNNTAFIDTNGKIILGTQGLFLTALSSYLQKRRNDKLLQIAIQLGNGIIFMQNKNGQLRHILKSYDFSTFDIYHCIYYDGESILGLIKLYNVTKIEKYLNSAKKSMDYLFRINNTDYRNHWIIYCSNEITKYVDNIHFYQLGIQKIKDLFNDIYYKNITNPTDFEKLIQAFELYSRIHNKNINITYPINFEADLLKTIKYRAKFQLNSFVFPEVGIYFKNPSKSIGAFYEKTKNYRIRNDIIQHSIVGYLYFVRNYKQIYSS